MLFFTTHPQNPLPRNLLKPFFLDNSIRYVVGEQEMTTSHI